MRKLTLALALVVGLIGFSSTATAGIVDLVLDSGTGQLTLRTNPGLNFIVVGMNFNGAGGGSFNILPLVQPIPNINPPTSVQFSVGSNLFVQLNPPAVLGQFVQTQGATILVGTLSNPGSVTAFNCNSCLSYIGGTAVENSAGETGVGLLGIEYFIVPEPAALALLGLGLAGLAFVRRSAA